MRQIFNRGPKQRLAPAAATGNAAGAVQCRPVTAIETDAAPERPDVALRRPTGAVAVVLAVSSETTTPSLREISLTGEISSTGE